jgi:2-oxo-4-hydroxy-4-carboxy-5-ureidoimidazoline decarboxylase
VALSEVIDPAGLRECCAAERWVEQMLAGVPYASAGELLEASERAFDGLTPADWAQAFAGHARIGEPRSGDARGSAEQAGAADTDPATRAALRAGNVAYEERFGHVFMIRAAGLTADEMLSALHQRLHNTPEAEFRTATEQQREITRLRLLNLTR